MHRASAGLGPGLAPRATDRELSRLLSTTDVLLVDFSARWCAPCRALDPAVERVAARHRDGVTVVVLDVDDSPGAAAAFLVAELPTLLVFKRGRPVRRLVGLVEERDLEEALAVAAAS